MWHFLYALWLTLIKSNPLPSPSLISCNYDSLFYFLLDFFFPLSSPLPPLPLLFFHTENMILPTIGVWFISFTIMFSSSIHFSANGSILFFTDRYYSFVYIVYICYTFIIYSSADCYLVVLCLTGDSTVAIKLGVQMSPWMPNSFPLGIHLKEGYLNHIYGKPVFRFSKKPLTVFHNGCAELDSKTTFKSLPLTILSCQSCLVLLLW